MKCPSIVIGAEVYCNYHQIQHSPIKNNNIKFNILSELQAICQ